MITKMYRVEGMMCDGCIATVKTAIKGIPEVIATQVQLGEPQAIISMRDDIPEEKLQQALAAAGRYHIHETADDAAEPRDRSRQAGRGSKVFRLFQHKKDCCK